MADPDIRASRHVGPPSDGVPPTMPVDLDLCDREPTHAPGAIQSLGWLLAVDDDLCVNAVSTNVPQLLDRRPSEVLGADLPKLLGPSIYDLVGESRLRDGRPTQPVRLSIDGRPHDVIAHVSPDRRTVFEFEPAPAGPDRDGELLDRVETEAERVLAEDDFEQATARLAEAIRRLAGFGRVVVYRFDEAWAGEVVAEDAVAGMDRYLGLRFPASDIPPQTRRLYECAPVRMIFDVRAAAAPLLGMRDGDVTLDLSRAVLRGVSPVHVRYLENMGVRSSMSISLMDGDQLWGLVACHDRGPMHPGERTRRAAAMIGRLAMPRIVELDPRRGARRRTRAHEHLDAMIHALTVDRDPLRLLADARHGALPLIPSEGLVVRIGDRIRTAGVVPGDADVTALLEHLDASIQTGVLARHRLVDAWSPAASLVRTAAGVLAIRIGRTRGDLLAWLRPEQPHVVRWAGDPRKPVVWDQHDVSRLQPRESFAAWQQDVRGESEPWLPWEIDLAQRMRGLLLNIVDRYDAYDTEQILRHRAESDLARAQTDLVRQRRAVLAMLADAAETGGDRERMRDVVAGLAPMVDRLASATDHQEEMVDIEERLADLERLVADPSDPRAPDRVRQLRRQVIGLLDVSMAVHRQGPVPPDGVEAVLSILPLDTPVAMRRREDGATELLVDRRLADGESRRLRELAERDAVHEIQVRDEVGRASVVVRRRSGADDQEGQVRRDGSHGTSGVRADPPDRT